jgi:putative oxidoreductase
MSVVTDSVSAPSVAPSTAAPAPVPAFVRLYASFARHADALQSLFALAIRLYILRVFLVSGLTKIQNWSSTLSLFQNEYHVPLLPPGVAALLGTAAELSLPVLLALGIGSRLTAVALFGFNIVAAISYPDLSPAGIKDHILWGALLLVLLVYGPGRYSLDRLIMRRFGSLP